MPQVSHVINYDVPAGGVEDWVHRVGRTGRQGGGGADRCGGGTVRERGRDIGTDGQRRAAVAYGETGYA